MKIYTTSKKQEAFKLLQHWTYNKLLEVLKDIAAGLSDEALSEKYKKDIKIERGPILFSMAALLYGRHSEEHFDLQDTYTVTCNFYIERITAYTLRIKYNV